MDLRPDDPSGTPEPLHGIDSAVLLRFVSGGCTAEEEAAVRRWAALDPANAAELEALAVMWRAPAQSEAGADTKAIWQRLAERCEAEEPTRPVLKLEVRPPSRRIRPWAAAAAAAAIIGVGVTMASDTLRLFGWRSAILADTASIVYATPPGQRARLTLPDGSTVQLGVASTLRMPRAFAAGGPRAVTLEGQAYFDVVHDATRPFTIYAGGSVVEDIGTAFNVRAYQDEHAVQVVVASGHVAMRRTAGAPLAASLAAGDLGELRRDGTAATRRVDIARYIGWTQGELRFDLVPLADVTRELGRWYDVDVRLGDSSLGDLRVTASFQNQTRDEAFTRLAQALDLRYRQRGRVATLESR